MNKTCFLKKKKFIILNPQGGVQFLLFFWLKKNLLRKFICLIVTLNEQMNYLDRKDDQIGHFFTALEPKFKISLAWRLWVIFGPQIEYEP